MANKYPSPLLWMLEDEMPEEYRKILSEHPKEKGWSEPYLYQYEGFWHVPYRLESTKTCQKYFEAQDTDIFIASSPKCGSTWLKALAFAVRNRNHYLPSDNNHPLLSNNSNVLVELLESKPDHSSSTKSPRIFASHLPYCSLPKSIKDSACCKLIYICRNPKDAFVSLWHFTNRIKIPQVESLSVEEAFGMFCRGVSLYGPFWEHVLQYWQESLKNPTQVLFLKYEDLRDEPDFHVKRIAEFMECPFSEEEEASGIVNEIVKLCSFNHLSNLEVNKTGKHPVGFEYNIFFRRAVAEDWKNYLTPDMADQLDRLTTEKFQGFGLKL